MLPLFVQDTLRLIGAGNDALSQSPRGTPTLPGYGVIPTLDVAQFKYFICSRGLLGSRVGLSQKDIKKLVFCICLIRSRTAVRRETKGCPRPILEELGSYKEDLGYWRPQLKYALCLIQSKETKLTLRAFSSFSSFFFVGCG